MFAIDEIKISSEWWVGREISKLDDILLNYKWEFRRETDRSKLDKETVVIYMSEPEEGCDGPGAIKRQKYNWIFIGQQQLQ